MSFAVLILCANEAVSSMSSMQVDAPPSSQILKDCTMFRLLEWFNKKIGVCATSMYWKEDEMALFISIKKR
jgi:hypothetical protein